MQQAQARVEQRQKEYDAKRVLVESGNLAKLGIAQFEADLKAAQAQLAAAQAGKIVFFCHSSPYLLILKSTTQTNGLA